ncbi:MAG: tRNA (N(6)-L-threonylcarbamoyladenosine(37)-C(2))-methylthiotransferase MtaB [Campylobacterota bacterium]
MSKQKVYFKTFGCRTNQFDTQVMMQNLHNYSVTSDEKDADIIVINSCTVTNNADGSVRNYISSVQKRSTAKIVFAGCGAFSQGQALFEKNKVHTVFGHSQKENIDMLLQNTQPTFSLGNLESVDKTIVQEFIGKSRCFIKIQEGCDFDCSYCIIPSVRGGARSHAPELILKQIEILAQNGYTEFILTGTNVGSFGKDINYPLSTLLQQISQIRGVVRIRLGSLEPSQLDDAFMELLDEDWMAKHLHIAIQHSSDAMLQIMRRKNRFASDLALFETLAQKGYAIGTDYIVGHPGESEAIFQEAFYNLLKMPLTHIHCFSYSQRDNTHAATLQDTVRGDIAKQRRQHIISLVADKNLSFRKAHTDALQVLVENKKSDFYVGYDQYFNQLKIESDQNLQHCWIEVDNVTTEKNSNFKKI